MGFFKRLKTITKAEINGLLDGLENPVAMLNEYSREMEEEIAKGQKALANQIFVEKKQSSLIQELEELVAKRSRQAKLAVEHGDEEMAKLAVQEKLINQKQLSLYKEQDAAIKAQTRTLVEKLTQLKDAYNELQHKKIVLASRANVANSIKQIQKTTVSFQTDTISRGVARAEERILMMEAEAQAGAHGFEPLKAKGNIYGSSINEEELAREIEKLKADKENGF